jgi:hypothetical protein
MAENICAHVKLVTADADQIESIVNNKNDLCCNFIVALIVSFHDFFSSKF